MFSNFDPRAFIITLVVIICSIALHEFGHALSADRLGDPGPRLEGRLTLWPDRHLELMGTIMIIVTSLFGFGLGWGRPVMVHPARFRHPNRDMMIVAAFGPLMNLLLAVVAGLILRFAFQTGHTAWLTGNPNDYAPQTSLFYLINITPSVSGQFVETILWTNLTLMFFNLIPITPLDGSKILYGLLPIDMATSYERLMAQMGLWLLILFLASGMAGRILGPAVGSTASALSGIHQTTLQGADS